MFRYDIFNAAAGIALAVSLSTTETFANDANFQYSGAREKALSGAGVADGNDATSIALNPAGLVHSDDEWSISGTLLHPLRGYDGGGPPGFTPSGHFESDREYFAIPNLALARHVTGYGLFDVVGISIYGNGGLNTTYPDGSPGSPGCAFLPVPNPGSGPYCFGKTGVNLEQSFLSIAVAKTVAPGISIGIAPILSVQKIKLYGFNAFAGASTDPANLTNKGNDYAFGYGVRGGIEWAVSPFVRAAFAASSRIYSQKLDDYRGAFAEGGDLDIPASLQAGIAVDVNPRLTLLADYKHVFFNNVASYHNPSTAQFPLGSVDGPGFGWHDIDVFKLGVEWQATPALTLRAGYSYNTDVVGSRDVLFNIIAPATTNHTFSTGFEYKYDSNWSVEFAAAYVPRDTLSGTEPPPPQGNPAHSIDLYLEQYEFTLGAKYRFDTETVSLK